MLKAMTARRSDDRGFTLVELMVVVLIIGILVAIAIPSFLNAQKTAQNTAAKANIRNAYSVAKAYQAQNNGSYGTALAIANSDTSLPWNCSGGPPFTACAAAGSVATGKITVSVSVGGAVTFETPARSDATYTGTDASGSLVYSCSGASCPAVP